LVNFLRVVQYNMRYLNRASWKNYRPLQDTLYQILFELGSGLGSSTMAGSGSGNPASRFIRDFAKTK
jgi:hypothetical protein